MSRYVDVEPLDVVGTKGASKDYADGMAYVLDLLDNLPVADVEPVRHAYDMDEYTSLFECSNCGWMCDDTYGGEPCVGNTVTYNYCPNCGAKIDYKIGYGECKE